MSIYIGVYYTTDTYIQKEKEVFKPIAHSNFTRFHNVPIILYHNIDGKGPYSIPFEKLKNQFTLLQNNDIKVISLQQMESHIDMHNPFTEKVVSITFDDGYYSMYSILMPLARSMNYPITLFVYIDTIMHRGTNNLTWRMLQIMQKNNIDIQCHSQSHVDLVQLLEKGTLESKYALYKEIYLSKKVLELYLNKTIDYFAFPYGRYCVELTELCRDAGYTRVFSTDYGPNIVTRDNYCLRRHHVKSSYPDEKVLSLAW
ncbi:MAG: polysaccharide deacetylase family protein [Spirochaetes bacterium]|nr:polysaccharide deacetylase family protein [Spirochaetota bacterium]